MPSYSAAELESVRRIVDPVQSRLIPAHVTLCREDEISGLSPLTLRGRFSSVKLKAITLHFGGPEAFFGHGILLHCIGGQSEFQALREQILGSTEIRAPQPHITLAHPRNPQAPGSSLASASCLAAGTSITFDSICLIEQEGKEPWQLLQSFPLMPA